MKVKGNFFAKTGFPGFAFLFLLPLLLTLGCGAKRYISNPGGSPADLNIGKVGDENLAVKLDYVIVPNGKGSWCKNAKWDEYVLTVENVSDKPITVNNLKLIDPFNRYVESPSDHTLLERQSESMAKEYEKRGFKIATYLEDETGQIMKIIASGGELALAPFAVFATPVESVAESYVKHVHKEDRDAVEFEFQRRRLGNFFLEEGGMVSGSAFFPIMPSPKTLVVDYRINNEFKFLEISLEKLKELHLGHDADGRF